MVIFNIKRLWELFSSPASQVGIETIGFFLAKADLSFSTCEKKFHSAVTAVTVDKESVIYVIPS